ncbi:MAG TPA: hypothetical protein VGH28_18390 [Polyangiaceae bacterium]|jgi:hypothetical protein
MTRLAWLLPLLFACSSSPARPAGDDASADAPVDAAAPDAPLTVTDAGADAGDAAVDPFVPHPPDGATECGSGTISASSSHSACMEPSFVLDDVPLFDGGNGSMPRACDALTVGGGEWQVWCTPSEVYVWGRIPIENASTLTDCHAVSLLEIDEGLYATANAGGNGAQVRTYEPDGTEIIGTPAGDPQTIVASITLPLTASGAAQMFVAGMLEDTCNQGVPGPPTVLTGFDVQWKE